MKYYGSIYLITNLLNNKKYVGQSTNPISRIRRHLSIVKSKNKKNHIHSAINKYGKDNFKFEEICSCVTSYSDLNELERYFIKYFNCYGDNGYNETLGGGGSPGKFASNETKEKMCIARKGKTPSLGMKHTEQTKNKMSEDRKGAKHPMFGKNQSMNSIVKNKMSQKTRISILCLETNNMYFSLREAAKDIKCDPSCFYKYFKGKIKNIKGLTFIKYGQ